VSAVTVDALRALLRSECLTLTQMAVWPVHQELAAHGVLKAFEPMGNKSAPTATAVSISGGGLDQTTSTGGHTNAVDPVCERKQQAGADTVYVDDAEYELLVLGAICVIRRYEMELQQLLSRDQFPRTVSVGVSSSMDSTPAPPTAM